MKYIFLLALYLVWLRESQCLDPRVDPLVLTANGLVRGLRATDGDYSMFLGIPYAKVDEDNPFGPSQPHPPFSGTLNAYDDTAICPQRVEFNNTISGTLDCLHLNVYVPNVADSQRPLPVLVWIYGGAFNIGFAGRYMYGPKYLVRHDVVLVTVNYRVGPYGFMCLNTPSVPGNQGLKDQLLGLQWIRDNIHAFGGDANQITLFGESAGGASVDYHLLSSHQRLYNKVIMQSGTSQCPWAISEPDLSAAEALARRLGHETDDTLEALSFLSTADPHLVIAAAADLQLSFGPCVEVAFEDVEVFIDHHPVNLEAPNKISNMPILLGFNSDEMILIHGGKDEDYFSNLGDVFLERLEENFDFEDREQLFNASKTARHFYLGDEPIAIDSKQDVIDFDSDFFFIRPTLESVSKYKEQGAGNVYLYMFSYNGGRNYLKTRLNITEGGSAHADELGYLFEQQYNQNLDVTPEDQLMIDRMTTLWTNFAKHSNPTPAVTGTLPVRWLPTTPDQMNYLNIDSEMRLLRRPFKQRTAFWELFYSSNGRYRKGSA